MTRVHQHEFTILNPWEEQGGHPTFAQSGNSKGLRFHTIILFLAIEKQGVK